MHKLVKLWSIVFFVGMLLLLCGAAPGDGGDDVVPVSLIDNFSAYTKSRNETFTLVDTVEYILSVEQPSQVLTGANDGEKAEVVFVFEDISPISVSITVFSENESETYKCGFFGGCAIKVTLQPEYRYELKYSLGFEEHSIDSACNAIKIFNRMT